MDEIYPFLTYILVGEFGLFTLTPMFLLTVLFPAVAGFNFLSEILNSVGRASPLLLSMILGFGCTTAAIATLPDDSKRERIMASVILCTVVPCSAQVAVMVPLIFLLDFPFVIFYFSSLALATLLLCTALQKILPGTPFNLFIPPQKKVLPNIPKIFIKSIKTGLIFIKDSAVSFIMGSLIVSLMTWCGVFAYLCSLLAPFTVGFLRLPEEAGSLFILSILKRDLGAAGLLNIIRQGNFSQAELTVTIIMLTLFVPCFASTVMLFKKERALKASAIWLTALSVSVAFGKSASLLILR